MSESEKHEQLNDNEKQAVRQAFAIACKSADDPVSAGVFYRSIEIKLGIVKIPQPEKE